MAYYKIILDDNVIDVGCAFLKWNTKRKKLNYCSIDEGQFIQGYKTGTVYTTSWLKPAPQGADSYNAIEAIIIDETEFNDIKEMLDEGETVVVETPVVPETPVERPVVQEEEKPMSIAEMRETIIHQQEQIEMLLETLNIKE